MTSPVAFSSARSVEYSPASYMADGHAGIAMFLAYAARRWPDVVPAEIVVDTISAALRGAEEQPTSLALFQGLLGVAWATEHIGRMGVVLAEDDLCADVDTLLLKLADNDLGVAPFDLMHGLVGMGIYALERLPHERAVRALELVVRELDARATRVERGLAWYTDRAWVTANRAAEYPDGYFDLGVAHGTPGVLAFLGMVYRSGIAKDTAVRLLEGGMSWLSSLRLSPRRGVAFEALKAPKSLITVPARTAWCYGDPGIALAMLTVAEATGETRWKRLALEIAQIAANRPFGETDVVATSFCHGTAGLAHVFRRLHHGTGEDSLKCAAQTWLELTLREGHSGQGVGGYRGLRYIASTGQVAWKREAGFLSGAAGVGLVLLASLETQSPTWDRVFLAPVF